MTVRNSEDASRIWLEADRIMHFGSGLIIGLAIGVLFL